MTTTVRMAKATRKRQPFPVQPRPLFFGGGGSIQFGLVESIGHILVRQVLLRLD